MDKCFLCKKSIEGRVFTFLRRLESGEFSIGDEGKICATCAEAIMQDMTGEIKGESHVKAT